MFGPFELPKWHLFVPFYILKAGIHIHFFSESSAGQVSLMAYLPGFNLGFPVVPDDYNLVQTIEITSKVALRTSEVLPNHKIFSKIIL